MKKIIFLAGITFLFSILGAQEHTLFETNGPPPNIMFLIDKSDSMNWGVYEHGVDYKEYTRMLATDPDFCSQAELGRDSYVYEALNTEYGRIDSEEKWLKWSNFLMKDENELPRERYTIYLLYNTNDEVQGGEPYNCNRGMTGYTDQDGTVHKIPADIMCRGMGWKSKGLFTYRGTTCYTGGSCSGAVDRQWRVDDPESINTVDGTVTFNYNAGAGGCVGGGICLPTKYYSCKVSGGCPRKITTDELIHELTTVGYWWTGYTRRVNGTDRPVFLTTGNWRNMRSLFNLNIGGTISNLRAWRTCTYCHDDPEGEATSQCSRSKTGGKAYCKMAGGTRNCLDDSGWWFGPEGEDKIDLTLVTDPTDQTKNGPGSATETGGVVIDKWSWYDGSVWHIETYDEPKKARLHRPNSSEMYNIPNNYVATFTVMKKGAVKVAAHFKHFDLKDPDDFMMLTTDNEWRMNRRIDEVREALSEVVESHPEIPFGISIYPWAIKGGEYSVGAGIWSPLSTETVKTLNALNKLAARGTTPTGEALVKVFDYFYNNQELCWSCRRNNLILISDGYPINDNPDSYISAETVPLESYSTHRHKLHSPSAAPDYLRDMKKYFPAYTDDFPNSMEGAASYLYREGRKRGIDLYWQDVHGESDEPGPYRDEEGNDIPDITIDTISFGMEVFRLKDTAERGGGKYYPVSNRKGIREALHEVVTEAINSNAGASAAPAVSLEGTRYGNNLYIPLFSAQLPGHWWGTVNSLCMIENGGNSDSPDKNCLFLNEMYDDGTYKYNEDSARERFSDLPYDANADVSENGFLTGTNSTLKAGERNVYHYSEGSFKKFEPEGPLGNFLQGCEYLDGNCIRRKNPMGDAWHSSPLYLEGDEPAIIVGTNSGFLHVIDAATGEEKKAIIPSGELFTRHMNPDRGFIRGRSKSDTYGVDLTPTRLRLKEDIESPDWISIGYRRGGHGYAFIKKSEILGDLKNKVEWLHGKRGSKIIPMGLSWAGPMIHRYGSSAKIVVPWGYDTFFDDSDKKTADFPSLEAHVFSAAFREPLEDQPSAHNAPEDHVYPVTGKIYPFNWKEGPEKDCSVAEEKETNVFYYADFIGNLFFHDGNPESVPHLLVPFAGNGVDNLSKQNLTSEHDGVTNGDVLKVFGSAKPVLRSRKSPEEEEKREVWIFYGTGDDTRVKK